MTTTRTESAPPPEDHSPAMYLAPRLARGIVAVVFSGFCLIAFLHILYLNVGAVNVALSAVYMILLLWLQLFVFGRPHPRQNRPVVYAALLCQAALVYLPLLQFEAAWVGLPGFLAGSVLLALPSRLAWPAFALVVASMGVTTSILFGEVIQIAYNGVSTTITGLVVYGLSRLSTLIAELHEARTELAQMAVAQERLRFARDLHDLLGYSLSAITLKSELTHRLVTKNPEKAHAELEEILDISRKALADVRSVASGYRELSLDSEAASARSVLIAADVDVTMDMDYGDLPVPLKTVLATVLREGITNVLRHSKAEHCDISVRQADGRVWLDIVNDGVHSSPPPSDGGSGIRNLSTRLEALDGELVAGIEPDGQYRLRASAPVAQVRTKARRH